jgi:hypothetical protein
MTDFIITPATWDKILRLPKGKRASVIQQIGQMEWDRCARDFAYWADPTRHWVPYAYTKDEHPLWECHVCTDKGEPHQFNKLKTHLKEAHEIEEHDILRIQGYFQELSPIRAFPYNSERYEYFTPIVNQWQTDQLMLVQKSRDMMASWLFIMLYTWDTLYHRSRQNFFQSENAAKTRDLVRRGYFIYRNQPKFLRDIHKATWAIGPANAGQLNIDDIDSEIIGFPQGEGQIRQYHPSGMYTDETAFHKDAGETFAAVKPAIQSGGRYTGVSSAYPGWFQLAAEDRLDAETNN